ncbi:hypothetical protein EAH76_21720 [Sphingomonas glacialis]|uniref:Uncharacterized protein n=1 Tax=Sphingomonas glacialis TaxID=658225 RepID=A0A502FF66_9SPHN|nr:hypothetical protein EAH76_21720 [Sphingomonas glacialis]
MDASGGLLSVIIGTEGARTLQHALFDVPPDTRLLDIGQLGLASLVVLPIGGLILIGLSLASQARKRRLIDAVEANALHGVACRYAVAWLFLARRSSPTGSKPRLGLKHHMPR